MAEEKSDDRKNKLEQLKRWKDRKKERFYSEEELRSMGSERAAIERARQQAIKMGSTYHDESEPPNQPIPPGFYDKPTVIDNWDKAKKRPTPLQEEFKKRRMEDTANTEDMDDEEYQKHWNDKYGKLWDKAKKKE